MRALSTTGVLLLGALTLLAARPAAADICTWNGSSGAWTDAARWNCGHVPTGPDTAVITGGTVTLGTSLSVAALQLSGGTLASGGTLTLTGTASSWTGGAMTGAGTTRVAAGAALALSGGPLTLRRRLRVDGDATWAVDAGQPLLGGSGQMIVGAGGEMRVTPTLLNSPPPGLTVVPALTVEAGGLFVSDAQRMLTFSGVVTSAGTIHSAYQSLNNSAQYAGTGLFFTGGGTLGGEVVSTNTVQFDAGTYALVNGLRFRKPDPFCGVCSTTYVDGATFVAQGTVSVESLLMREGVIEGAGDLVASSVSLNGGVLRGTGALRATGFVFLDGAFSLERETHVESGGYLGWTWGFAGNPGPFAAGPASITVQTGGIAVFRALADGTLDIPFAIEAGATLALSTDGNAVPYVVSLPQLYANPGTISLNVHAVPSSDVGVVLRPGRLFVNTGAIQGMGGLDLAGTAFTNKGTVEPYAVVLTTSNPNGTRVPAALTVEGDYTNATLRLDLNVPPLTNPVGPVAPFDRLLISGAGQLGGVLDLQAIGSPPLSNDTLVVVTCAGGCTGTFATVIEPAGFDLDVVYLADRVLVVDNYRPPLVDCTWNQSDGPWHEASRWSCGHVPGPPDRAIINHGRADVNTNVSVGALTLRQNGQIGGAATLTLLGASTWSGGFMNQGGITAVGPDATLTLPGEAGNVVWVGRRVEVAGAVEWTGGGMNPGYAGNGYGPFVVADGGVFTSRVSGVNTEVPFVVESGGEMVHDASGTLTLGGLSNAGAMRVLQGTLALQSGSTLSLHSGAFDTAAGAQIRFALDSRFGAGTTFVGDGLIVATGGNFRLDADLTIPRFRYENGNLTGAGSLTIGEAMTWIGGITSPGGPIVVPAGATLDVPSSPGAVWLGRPLDVAGTMQWNAAGGPFIYGYAGNGYGPITLQDGSTFTITGAAAHNLEVPVFVEPGAVLVRDGTGSARLNGALTNDGTIRLAAGGLRPSGGLTQRGHVEGVGTLDVDGLSWTNTGTFAPGASPGLLTVAGSYTNRVLAVELGGTAPGTQHDRLVVTGAATLADTLRLSLVGSDAPAIGDTYTVLTAGSLAGTFSTVEAPTGVGVSVAYTATSVVITVTDVATLRVVRTEPSGAVVVPAGGSTFSIKHKIINTGSTPETFDTWLVLTGPNGVTVPAGGPDVLTLAAGANSIRKKALTLTAGAAPGTYVLTRFVGTYPDGVVASESYTFTKAASFALAEPLPDDVAVVEGEVDEGLLLVTSDDEAEAALVAPVVTGLGTPYPNPAVGQTVVRFEIAETAALRVVVYDVLGRAVAVLADGERAAGRYEAVLDARALAEGTYIVRMTADQTVFTRRLTVVR